MIADYAYKQHNVPVQDDFVQLLLIREITLTGLSGCRESQRRRGQKEAMQGRGITLYIETEV